jgi:hypothetical protein
MQRPPFGITQGSRTRTRLVHRLVEHPTEQAAIRRIRELRAGEDHTLRQIAVAVPYSV